MSEIQVGQINSTDGSTAITTGADGYVSFAKTQIGGRRNLIINGGQVIAQRGTGAVTANGGYAVDRFQSIHSTDGAFSAQQDSGAPAGFINSLKFTTTTADASLSASQYAGFNYAIEGLDASCLSWGTSGAKPVTLSFWVRSSLTGTFGGVLKNSASDRSYPFTYTISAADTWEYQTITVTGDTTGTWLTTNGIGVRLQFGLGVGSTLSGTAGSWAGANYVSATGAVSVIGTLNATWQITGVQLEVGPLATPFEHRSYGEELALCQRYFISYGRTSEIMFSIGTILSNRCYTSFQFPNEMRTAPSASYGGNWRVVSASSTQTSISPDEFYSPGTLTGRLRFPTGSHTNGQACLANLDDSTAYLELSAEL